MKRIIIIILILQSCTTKNESKTSGFDLSFHNCANKIYSYKLDESGTIYYSHILYSTIHDTLPGGIKLYANVDTVSGETKLNLKYIDSIKTILKNVISDSLNPSKYKCKDCGCVIIIDDKEYIINDNQLAIEKLFRIEKFIQIDSSDKTRKRVLVFKSLDKLFKTNK